MTEYIEREAAIALASGGCHPANVAKEIAQLPAADVVPVPDGDIGEISDGYHTFNGLYYQRMVLFAALVNAHKKKAWKSWKHEDGELCFGGGWFIVGIDTPQGGYTYHYKDRYWNWFDCVELPVGNHWDGHTEKDVARLLSLDVRPVVRGEWLEEINRTRSYKFVCSACCKTAYDPQPTRIVGWVKRCRYAFCPNCGAEMKGAE